MIFGRTDLRISLSGTKFDAEADVDACSAVGPPRPHQVDEKLIFRSDKFAENFCRSNFFLVSEISFWLFPLDFGGAKQF